MCVVIIVVQFYFAVAPLGSLGIAKSFFANYVSVILIVALWAGAKIYYRGRRWVDLSAVDLDFGRRFYHDEADQQKGQKKGIKSVARRTLGAIVN